MSYIWVDTYKDIFRFNSAGYLQIIANPSYSAFQIRISIHGRIVDYMSSENTTITGRLHPAYIHHEEFLLLCFLKIYFTVTNPPTHINAF